MAEDPWKKERSISNVFANALRRTKNDDFLSESLEVLQNAFVLQRDQINQAMVRYSHNVKLNAICCRFQSIFFKNRIFQLHFGGDKNDENHHEETEEALRDDLANQVSRGMMREVFKIPEDQIDRTSAQVQSDSESSSSDESLNLPRPEFQDPRIGLQMQLSTDPAHFYHGTSQM